MSHYSIVKIESIDALRTLFPDGKADYMNFVLFSTSGIHGSYTSLEDIERSLSTYGEDFVADEDGPDDYVDPDLTVVVVQPRMVCMRYGKFRVHLSDIDYLRKIRETSIVAVQLINAAG